MSNKNNRAKTISLFIIFFFMASPFLYSCGVLKGIGGKSSSSAPTATLVSIEVTPTNPSIALGTTEQFTATGIFSDGSTQNITSSVTWSSLAASVATVSNTAGSNGKVTPVSAGTTTITATSGNISFSAILSVTSATLVSIAVTSSYTGIAVGTTDQFTATGTFSDNSTQDITSSVTWSSSKPAVATVSNTAGTNGKVTAVATGTTTITATSASISGAATLTVTSGTLVSIAVTSTYPSIAPGTTEQFTATGIFSDNSTQNITSSVTWNSSNTSAATISNSAGSYGQVTPVAAGTTTITATSGNISGATALTVTSATLVSIAVTSANPIIALGTSEQFTATGTFSDKSTQNITSSVTWSSSNTPAATISNTSGSNGKVTAVAAGTATITATSGSISGSSTLIVTSATLVSIAVTTTSPSIAPLTAEQFTAIGTFSDNSTQDITSSVTWSSSNAPVAAVSNTSGFNGKVTAVAAGTAKITATSGSISGSSTLTVTGATLTQITITQPGVALTSGTTVQYTATGTFSDKTTGDITSSATWASSNTSVAVVSNAAGYEAVTAVAAGTAKITATSGSISGSSTVTVSAVTSAPNITATVLSLVGGSNPSGYLQQIQVYTDSSSFTPITNATVTINGSPVSYNAAKQSYDGNVVIAAGAAVNLSVTIGGTAYAASGTQYIAFPGVTSPASGSTWQHANANNINWTAGAPTTAATYFVGIANSAGNIVYQAGSNGKSGSPVNVPTSTASYTVPANSLTAGNYYLFVGIGTQGIGGESSGGIPIPNTTGSASSPSGLWIGGIASFVPITVQ